MDPIINRTCLNDSIEYLRYSFSCVYNTVSEIISRVYAFLLLHVYTRVFICSRIRVLIIARVYASLSLRVYTRTKVAYTRV